MKIKHLVLSGLCAAFAVSCQTDATEDLNVNPNGESNYFDLTLSATGVSSTGTKVGFDPTKENEYYLYWTSDESISVVDASTNTAYAAEYTAPADSESVATFGVESFAIEGTSATEIQVFATSPQISEDGIIVATEGTYTVTVPELTYAGDTDYEDALAANLPFISDVVAAGVAYDNGYSYTGDAPALVMSPIFHVMNVKLPTLSGEETEEVITKVVAAIQIKAGGNFYESVAVTPSTGAYVGSGAATEVKTTVSYTGATTAALSETFIPVASLATSDTVTAFDVVLSFYNSYDVLVASATESFSASEDFAHGDIDKVTVQASSVTFGVNKLDAVTSLAASVSDESDASEITLTWTWPTDVTNITGATIYYAEVTTTDEGEVVGDYYSVLYSATDIAGDAQATYVLGSTSESLSSNTTYSIYVETCATGYVSAATEAVTATTPYVAEDPDIALVGSTYEIYSAEGLVAFAGIVNGSYSETTPDVVSEGIDSWAQNASANGTVVDDIDLSTVCYPETSTDAGDGVNWTPIAAYAGTFDGGSGSGYSISNLTIDVTTANQGLFASLATGAVVQNVTLSDVSITSSVNTVGAIAGTATGATITDCDVLSGSITGNTNIGGIVGVNYHTSITNCDNSAAIYSTATGNSTTAGVGGIVGTMGVNSSTDAAATQTTMIENCTNSGAIDAKGAYAGGMVGSLYVKSDAAYGYEIKDCENTGAIESTAGGIGGFSGYIRADVAGFAKVTNYTNDAAIKGSGTNIGGFIGYGTCGNTAVGIVVENSKNTAKGTVTNGSFANTGGIAGQLQNGYSVTSCHNYAAIYSESNNVGGIIGNKGTGTTAAGSVSYCNNEGNVTGTTAVGGIAGTGTAPLTGTSADKLNYNSGTVSGTDAASVGGIVGSVGAGTMTYYTNTGLVYVDGVVTMANSLYGACTGDSSTCVDGYAYAPEASSVTASSTASSTPTISVSWSYADGTEGIASSRVYYSTTEGTYTYYVDVDGTTTSATIPTDNLTVSATYYVYVVTIDQYGAESGSAASTTSVEVSVEKSYIASDSDIKLVAAGDDYDKDTYEIYTANGLVAFADLVNGTTTSDYIAVTGTNLSANAVVKDNIDLSTVCYAETTDGADDAVSWTPIGNGSSYAYTGTFDGGSSSYTISNLYINTESSYQGLFGYVGAGTIQNVKLADVDVTTGTYSGAFIGQASGSTITACELYSGKTTLTLGGYSGGIAGKVTGGTTIRGCVNRANIKGTGQQTGGIAGTFNTSSSGLAYLYNCTNYGSVSGVNYVGGIMGYVYGSSSSATIDGCTNEGAIEGSTSIVGGIAGAFRVGAFKDCTNNGTVKATSGQAGGIAGLVTVSGTMTITNCHNTNLVTATTVKGGGIYGAIGTSTAGTLVITNSTNSGAVSGTTNVGGIAGHTLANVTIGDSTGATTCSNSGNVTGSTDAAASVGGLVGTSLGAIYYTTNSGIVSPTQQLVGTSSTGAIDDYSTDNYSAE